MKIDKASKLAVQNVFKEGLTDIFDSPFEIDLLKNQNFQKKVIAIASKCIKGNSLDSLDISQIEHVLLPKGTAFDFRRCALIHPLDTIKYLALALIFADELEPLRPRKSRKIVFSYRFRPYKGYIFDPKYNITSFKKHVNNKIKQARVKALVICDIANFYDRLNLHRLESVLDSISSDKNRVKQINQLLLFWANRNSYSLPVGSNASRILSEAALLEVDNYLLSIGVKFCRFVDDYRLFAPNIHTAHYWLTQLIERLWVEGLTINQRKTEIKDVSQSTNYDAHNVKSFKVTTRPKQIKKSPDKPELQFRLMAGYGGAIPTRFRALSIEEIDKFSKKNPLVIYKELKEKKVVKPEDVKLFTKSVIATKQYHYFRLVPELSGLFPQFTPYLIDVLIKFRDSISEKIRAKLVEDFSGQLKANSYLPEYITISIVGLLGCKEFQDKNALLNYFRSLKRNAGAYIGRSLLESLEGLVSRNEVLEIRDFYTRADSWEKRQIVKIVDTHLSEDEKRPFLRNVKIQESRDIFLGEYIKVSKNKKK